MSLLILFDGGPSTASFAVDPLSDDTVMITFADELLVDTAYLDPNSYEVTLVSGDGEDVSVRSVVSAQDAKTINDVILVLDKPTYGAVYSIAVAGLSSRSGGAISGTASFAGRGTKTESMIRALPAHYNTRADSVIRAVLTAIGIQDDIIGGSRDDDLD